MAAEAAPWSVAKACGGMGGKKNGAYPPGRGAPTQKRN